LAAGSLGVAGVFARSRMAFVLLAVALLTSSWYDLGRIGFLGKCAGYPASLLATGLFFHFVRLAENEGHTPIEAIYSMAAIVVCSALVYSALLSGLLLVGIGGTFLLFDCTLSWAKASPRHIWFLVALAAFALLGFLSSGVVARPLYVGTGGSGAPWPVLFRWAAQVLDPPALHSAWLSFTIFPCIWLALGLIAILKKVPETASLIVFPMILFLFLYVANQGFRFEQVFPIFMTTAFCAAAILLGESMVSVPLISLLLIVPIAISALRIPEMLAIFGGSRTPPLTRFALSETEQLAAAIGSHAVMIDVDAPDPSLSTFLMVELGWRGVPLQFSERSWRHVMGYRPWPLPSYPEAAPFLIIKRSSLNVGPDKLVVRTAQFDLLRQN